MRPYLDPQSFNKPADPNHPIFSGCYTHTVPDKMKSALAAKDKSVQVSGDKPKEEIKPEQDVKCEATGESTKPSQSDQKEKKGPEEECELGLL